MLFSKTPAAFAAAGLMAATLAFAQTPPPPPAPPLPPGAQATTASAQTLSGTLRQWLINPNGEVDGLLLDDGTQVSFPPHLSAQLTQAVKPKDSLRITGWRGPGDAGAFRAMSIASSTSGRSVADQPPEPGAAPPRPGTLTAMSASGRITRVLTGAMGEANGVLLDGGSIVRFPPHVGTAMAASLRAGATLYARGYGTRNSYGSALEATSIGPTMETAHEVFGPPPGPLAGAPGVAGPRPMPMPMPPDAAPAAIAPSER